MSTANQEKTIFQKIIDGELPSTKVYEDDFTCAFLDIHPSTFGHTLVVSKTPFRNLLDIPEEDLQHLILAVQKVAKLLYEKLPNCEGVNIIQNNEPEAGQIVFHIHFHVIPRYADDGLRHWPGNPFEPTDAEKVKSYLGL